jgi:hypothetical protein
MNPAILNDGIKKNRHDISRIYGNHLPPYIRQDQKKSAGTLTQELQTPHPVHPYHPVRAENGCGNQDRRIRIQGPAGLDQQYQGYYRPGADGE